jgi:hypothetical protein
MKQATKIDISFAKRIAFEEWRKFKIAQDAAIQEKLVNRTNTLHKGGPGRKYTMTMDKDAIILSLEHRAYLRFQDIKKLKVGRKNAQQLRDRGKHAMARHDERMNADLVTKSGGKRIHNRLVWGRMNSIAFRCMNDLRGDVIKFVKDSWALSKHKTIQF